MENIDKIIVRSEYMLRKLKSNITIIQTPPMYKFLEQWYQSEIIMKKYKKSPYYIGESLYMYLTHVTLRLIIIHLVLKINQYEKVTKNTI